MTTKPESRKLMRARNRNLDKPGLTLGGRTTASALAETLSKVEKALISFVPRQQPPDEPPPPTPDEQPPWV
jgi:hypothetical protein